MEGDYLELSQFPYNPHQFPYNSHQSPLGTTGFLTTSQKCLASLLQFCAYYTMKVELTINFCFWNNILNFLACLIVVSLVIQGGVFLLGGISDPSKGIFGAGAHSDYGLITLLTTDGISDSQVSK